MDDRARRLSRRRGRRPAGPGGARTSEYRVLSVRVPDDTHRLLKDLATALDLNRAQVVEAALPALAYACSGDRRKALETIWRVRHGAIVRSAKVVRRGAAQLK